MLQSSFDSSEFAMSKLHFYFKKIFLVLCTQHNDTILLVKFGSRFASAEINSAKQLKTSGRQFIVDFGERKRNENEPSTLLNMVKGGNIILSQLYSKSHCESLSPRWRKEGTNSFSLLGLPLSLFHYHFYHPAGAVCSAPASLEDFHVHCIHF